jgi:hypothetical protein
MKEPAMFQTYQTVWYLQFIVICVLSVSLSLHSQQMDSNVFLVVKLPMVVLLAL